MSKKEETRKKKHQVQSLRSVKIDPFFFCSFYVSHFCSIQSGQSFKTSTSLTCYKWSKPVIFQSPKMQSFPYKAQTNLQLIECHKKHLDDSSETPSSVSTLIPAALQTHSHKKPLAIFITTATHWASARETTPLRLYEITRQSLISFISAPLWCCFFRPWRFED